MGPRATAILATAFLGACEPQPGDLLELGDPVPITAMTYNLANATSVRAQTIAQHIEGVSPDFVGAQECGECPSFVEQLPPAYELVADARAGVALFYDASTWQVEEQNSVRLGNNDDLWGERVASWARFLHLETNQEVRLYSTHWCVTVRSSDDECDEVRHLEYAETLLGDIVCASDDAPVMVLGDFNVFDGFDQGLVVETLVGSGLNDVFRSANPSADGTTFQGNDFAPAGRIDYVFASEPVEVLSSKIERDAIPDGQGSDHYAVTATVLFEK